MLPELVYANKLEFTSNGVNLNPEMAVIRSANHPGSFY
jgi:hypothetical protein